MVLVQLTGLSGAGKSTLAKSVKEKLAILGYKVEIIDGDEYRFNLCKDLGFSKEDRNTNIRRLGFVGKILARNGVIAILAAINPYESVRKEITAYGSFVKTVWVKCDMQMLQERDTKDLYRRAALPNTHPDKINNLTGVNDPYDLPEKPDLIIETGKESSETSVENLLNFIIKEVRKEELK